MSEPMKYLILGALSVLGLYNILMFDKIIHGEAAWRVLMELREPK